MFFELNYGKPAEAVEVDTTDLDQMRVAEMTQAERAVIIRQLLQQHPNLVGLVPERIRAEYGLPESARLRTAPPTIHATQLVRPEGWNLPMTELSDMLPLVANARSTVWLRRHLMPILRGSTVRDLDEPLAGTGPGRDRI